MDFNLASQVPLPQSNQTQQAPNATTQAGATSTVQDVPDNVVTATTEPAQSNAREDDALRRQDKSVREQAASQLEDLEIQGLSTRVGFDAESDTVFLEIVNPTSEEVIQRIPSENLVEFLSTQVSTSPSPDTGDSQALDRSV